MPQLRCSSESPIGVGSEDGQIRLWEFENQYVGDNIEADEESLESGNVYRPTTYRAKLYSPLFYSSREGWVIETQPILSATALTHALGYTIPEIQLEKRFVERGSEATTPTYDHLRDLQLFCTDMTPVNVSVDERTFRTVSYVTENRVVTSDDDVAKQISVNSTHGSPKINGNSKAGWTKVQQYVGISPGSEYEFTVWTPDSVTLSDTIRFQMGISRSGAFVARKKSSVAEKVVLNAFLLSEVYDLGELTPADVLEYADEYRRGNDSRLHHYVGVDRDWVEKKLIP